MFGIHLNNPDVDKYLESRTTWLGYLPPTDYTLLRTANNKLPNLKVPIVLQQSWFCTTAYTGWCMPVCKGLQILEGGTGRHDAFKLEDVSETRSAYQERRTEIIYWSHRIWIFSARLSSICCIDYLQYLKRYTALSKPHEVEKGRSKKVTAQVLVSEISSSLN